MAYVSLYRKYRSQSFDDVVGQDHVTRTIRNAIKAGRIGQAYLFCGSRGTGKTTVARLIAKAVNCQGGPTADPCNQCPACLSITEGSAVDIVEMDAASHRKVEDVDSLRDGVKYPPMHLRYKVYIIDEAHQLSAHAKDAFLKTLEEPPPHAIFILATTEAHEIPLTIRSRCQQFDFRRGSDSEVGSRLSHVAVGEGVDIDQDALAILSEAAAGSYRDGLSLLEQVVTYCEERVTAKDVGVVLGTIDEEALLQIAQVVASRDAAAALELAGRLVEEGKDIRQLLRSITTHFRRLLLISVGAASQKDLQEQTGLFSRGRLLRLVELFAGTDKELRFNDQHRLVLELALLKAMEEPVSAVVEPTIVKAIESAPTARIESKTPVKPPAPPSPEPEKPKPAPAPQAEADPPPSEPSDMEVIEETEASEVKTELSIDKVIVAWPKALVKVRATISAIAREAVPISIEGSTIVFGFPASHSGFHLAKFNNPSAQQEICAALSEILKTEVKARGVVSDTAPIDDPSYTDQSTTPSSGGALVDQALDMFGGQIEEDDRGNPWEEQ